MEYPSYIFCHRRNVTLTIPVVLHQTLQIPDHHDMTGIMLKVVNNQINKHILQHHLIQLKSSHKLENSLSQETNLVIKCNECFWTF